MTRTTRFLVAAAALLLAACDNDDGVVIVNPDPPGTPRDLLARYEWVLEDFSGGVPVGHPSVALTWLPPTDWDDEVFRVYGKRASSSGFTLIATVTSCTVDGCVYRDVNVAPSTAYEYYVAAVNERTGEETTTEFREAVSVPSGTRPAAPQMGTPVGLDGAVYLPWADDPANGDNVSRYLVYLTALEGQSYTYRVGETDGTGFLDEQAENGFTYGYSVATVDTLGHVSNLTAQATVIPRPDFHGELLLAHGDDPARSGFRFPSDEATDPVVPGTSLEADFRFEADGAGWRIVPLNGAAVLEHPERTTALTCGPGADAGCRAVTVAPATGYSTAPVEISPEYSYVFRLPGAGGQVHYGVLRVTLLGSDQDGNALVIFDWALQLIPDEPRLDRIPG